MKQTRCVARLLALSTLLVSAAVLAQTATGDAEVAADVQEARQLLQAGREEIVREELRMTSEEAAAFWPAYTRYQDELAPIRDRYADLLAIYLDAYRSGAVSESFAVQLVDDFLDIQGDMLKVKKKHLRHFRKALPARKSTRFYQLENKMEAETAGQLAQLVPLIDPV